MGRKLKLLPTPLRSIYTVAYVMNGPSMGSVVTVSPLAFHVNATDREMDITKKERKRKKKGEKKENEKELCCLIYMYSML